MTVVPLTSDRFDEFVDLLRALADYERLDPPDAEAVERLRRDAFGDGTPGVACGKRFEAALALNSKGKAVGYATWWEGTSSR